MQKVRYFTPATIQKKSQELLASVEKLRRRHADIVLRPERAALLVLDLQEYFFREDSHAFIPSAPAILPGISKLIVAFQNLNSPVIVTYHANTPHDSGMMSKWWRDLINPHSAYSHVITIANSPNLISLNKTQYDAFHQTPLEQRLNELEVEQVVISGVMTHLCCETTARSAFMRGFEVFFTVDGTATYTDELHRASLLTLSHGFAVPVLIEEMLMVLETNAT